MKTTVPDDEFTKPQDAEPCPKCGGTGTYHAPRGPFGTMHRTYCWCPIGRTLEQKDKVRYGLR